MAFFACYEGRQKTVKNALRHLWMAPICNFIVTPIFLKSGRQTLTRPALALCSQFQVTNINKMFVQFFQINLMQPPKTIKENRQTTKAKLDFKLHFICVRRQQQ